MPVWCTGKLHKCIYVSVGGFWHIANVASYLADNEWAWATANSQDNEGIPKCPQDLDYQLWFNNTWTHGLVSVTSGKHDF